MPDADAAAVRAHRAVVAHSEALDMAVADRAAAVAALRGEGWTLQAIADLLGVSKTRVAQIAAR